MMPEFDRGVYHGKGDNHAATARIVRPDQRFTPQHPCPICGGHERLPRGHGRRCHGFLSNDRQYAHCGREEYANDLPHEEAGDTYAHKLTGDCRCGRCHDPRPDTRPAFPVNDHTKRAPIVATYDYPDATGTLVYQVVRRADKTFTQRRPDGAGGWVYSLAGVPRIPYRLPELLAADRGATVWYPEGEKDADNLAALGLTATTNSEGAGKLRPEAAEAFRGRRVILLPDNDDTGRDGAAKSAAVLHGIAREVRLLALPGLPEHGDVSDWLAAGGTVEQLITLANTATAYTVPASGVVEDADIPPFPVNVLPGAAGRLVREGAAALDVPPEFIAVPLLALAGGTLGNRYSLELKPGYRQWPILYAAVVGGPGSGKTPAADLARGPIDRRQKEAWQTYQTAYEQYQAERAAWEALPKKDRAGQTPPDEPVLEKFFTTDATMEALGRILTRAPGLTYYRDELVGWVKACDQYRAGKGNDRQKWLEGWSKTPWAIDRKTGPPLYIPDPAVSVVGGIQPDVLPELQHEAGARDGFIERILWSYPAESFPDDTDAVVESATREAAYHLFVALRPPDACCTDDGAAGDGRPAGESGAVLLSADAKSLWKSWHRDNTRLLRAAAGLVQGIYAKLPNQAARLALILHCLTYPEAPAGRRVSAATMGAALELVEYFRAHALRVLPKLGQHDAPAAESLVGKVAAILDAAHGAWVSKSAIRDALHRNPDAGAVGEALARLAEQGRAERRVNREAGAGRPPEEWRSLVDAQTRERENAESSPGDDEVLEWRG